ncbi:MAG: CheR family methyltransferase [Enterocloster bolteae]
MVNRLTTNYTYFMREPAHFSILHYKILPELFENRKMGVCSIWNAGCSTGEEVYSIAMLIQDYRDRFERMPAVRILAIDISAEVLRKAEKGVVSAEGNGGPSGPLEEKVLYGGGQPYIPGG